MDIEQRNMQKESDKAKTWHWQEKGTTWKGVGIYHLTMTITDRRSLLGELIIPDNDPQKAYVKRSELGEQIVRSLLKTPTLYPEIWVMSWCVMPDHLHAIIHVKQEMHVGIRTVARSFWQAAKKIGRDYSMSIELNRIQQREEGNPDTIRDNEHRALEYDPLFREMPFLRPLSRRGQLDTMVKYVMDNPKRLATKRLMPGYFHVQHGVEINGRVYDIVGNAKILMKALRKEVHVRQVWVDDAEIHGDTQVLDCYMTLCIESARKGAVMISPFISKHEKIVLKQLMEECLPIVYLSSNGFGDYYKPSGTLFEAVANGNVLIVSPWEYNPDKKAITKAECKQLNLMAEEMAKG